MEVKAGKIQRVPKGRRKRGGRMWEKSEKELNSARTVDERKGKRGRKGREKSGNRKMEGDDNRQRRVCLSACS